MKLVSKKIGIISAVLIVLALGLFFKGVFSGEEKTEETAVKIKEVETILLNNMESNGDRLTIAGKVTPEKQVAVVALNQGTVISSPFNVGDEIEANQVLLYLNSDLIKTSHLNSQINYTNMINNLESVKLTTSESVRQASLGVDNAEQAVNSALITLETAEDNLKNAILLQEKTYIDQHDQAVISFYDFLNSIDNNLYQINYIIGVEEGPQLDGIDATLSARNLQSLNDAKSSYLIAKEAYNSLKNLELNNDKVKTEFVQLNTALGLLKTAIDNTIEVLNNTVTSSSFSEASLTAQKTTFFGLRASVVTAQSKAAGILSGLENLNISNNSAIESLENAVDAAKKNVDLVRGNYNNAVSALNSVRQAKNQQILIAQASVDGALGQLNLSSNQLAELTVKAPITGKITKKLIETGSEVRAGQEIAEISQIDRLKIEINLAAEDLSRIRVGQEVEINNSLKGIVSLIGPSADEVTKKIKVEISFDNKDKELIAGTFVDISLNALESGISSDDSSIILIPLKALNISQTEKYVFVTDCFDNNCFAKKVSVTVGQTKGKMIEILAGLDQDSELLVVGSKTVAEGEEIIIKK